MKYTYNDFHIGDTVITTNNDEGVIVAIKSIAYLNDKIIRKSKSDKTIIDLMPFNYDNTRHKGTWYSVLTLAIQDKSVKTPTYYLEAVDFMEVKKIVSSTDEAQPKLTLWQKIKKIFTKKNEIQTT